jgi:YqxM protein
VKNSGEAMAGLTDWELWYAASGPPKAGAIVAEGKIPALTSGQEYTIEKADVQGSGSYKFKAFQRDGYPGTGELWSGDINFDCSP